MQSNSKFHFLLDLDNPVTHGIVNVIGAILILLVGAWLAARLANFAQRALTRARFDSTLSGFLRNLLYGVLIAVLVVMALQQLGVPSAPLVAALGTAGLAIGLALQGSLSNLAWGVLLIVFRPFSAGDYVSAGGVEGTVQSINLLHTLLILGDNREAIVPNSKIGGDAIMNFNRLGTRRFEVKVGIGYKENVGKVMDLVRDLLEANPRILKDPAPGVWIDTLGDSAVNLVIRGWTRASDGWDAQTELLRAIKEGFDAHGISIPGPAREIALIQAPPSPVPADEAQAPKF